MKPKVTREQARELWQMLKGRGFVKAKNLDMESRLIRAICAEQPEHFLSTQSGYALVRECSDAQVSEAIADLRSRAKCITARADALDAALQRRNSEDLFDGMDNQPAGAQRPAAAAGSDPRADAMDAPEPAGASAQPGTAALGVPRSNAMREQALKTVGLHKSGRFCADCERPGKVGDLQPHFHMGKADWLCTPCRQKRVEKLRDRRMDATDAG